MKKVNKKEIVLSKATDKEILIESLTRRGIEPSEENLNKWRLMLMDVETINAIKGNMSYKKMSKTEIGKI